MKTICKEFTVKTNIWSSLKGGKISLIDVIFTPIYELSYKNSKMYFKSFEVRDEAINFLKKGVIASDSTFEYIDGLKVYTKII